MIQIMIQTCILRLLKKSVIIKRKFSFLVQLDNTFCCLKYLFLKVFEGILIVCSYIFASVIFDVAWFYFS